LRDANRLCRKRRALGDIPDVAFDQDYMGVTDGIRGDVGDTQLGTGTEIGLHRTLPILIDQDMAACRR
jgi:hypothetical protein